MPHHNTATRFQRQETKQEKKDGLSIQTGIECVNAAPTGCWWDYTGRHLLQMPLNVLLRNAWTDSRENTYQRFHALEGHRRELASLPETAVHTDTFKNLVNT